MKKRGSRSTRPCAYMMQAETPSVVADRMASDGWMMMGFSWELFSKSLGVWKIL